MCQQLVYWLSVVYACTTRVVAFDESRWHSRPFTNVFIVVYLLNKANDKNMQINAAEKTTTATSNMNADSWLTVPASSS